jgi:predicted dehydrogenase
VLADDTIDIVNICAMSDTHCELITKAMDAGKHIVTEKPAGYNLEECRKLRWYARKHPKLKVAIAYSLRYDPMNIKVRQLVKDGAIGVPTWGRFDHCHEGHVGRPDAAMSEWGIDSATDKGGRYIPGSDMCHATHPYDLARYFLGEPKEVFALRNSCATFVTLRFVSEAIGQVVGGSSAAEGIRSFMPVTIQGTAGTLCVVRMAPAKGKPEEAVGYLMNDARKGAKVKKLIAPKDTGHGDYTRARTFIEALRHGAPLICDLEDGVRTSEMLHAIWNSFSLGIRVPIQRCNRTG